MPTLDTWLEIWETVRKNRLRTFLTGLAVAWGIFMLVVLMGAGSGLQHGAEHQFRDDAVNSIWIHSGKTSIPWDGQPVGRPIELDNADHDAIARQVQGVEHQTSRYNLWNNHPVVYGNKTSSFDVRSVHPDHRYLEKTEIVAGRYVDDLDLRERRKVAVIGVGVAAFLFGDEPPLGKVIKIGGVAFTVVGVFTDAGNEGEQKLIVIPITTAQRAFGGRDAVHTIMFTVGDATPEASKAIERQARALLAGRHDFAPDDEKALRVRNNLEEFQQISDIFLGIRFIVWLVGIGTILAGVVGVSNIMLITVRERTREFGIRKALGATPASIIAMVVLEAIVLTSVAGYFGLLAGIGLVELLGRNMPPGAFFRDPTIDVAAALQAMGLLVVSGALAGFFPAWRAARINPVEALRDE
jgi:putative ABC transport system permease protein